VVTSRSVGYGTTRSAATESAGHQKISGPMCVCGRQAQTQRPVAIATVIATKKRTVDPWTVWWWICP